MGQTSLTVQISGLQNAENLYGGFRYKVNSGSWISHTDTDYTFTGLTASTTYTLYAQAKWGTTWYDSGSCSGTTLAPPPPSAPGLPTGVSSSVNGLSVTISWTKGTNAYSTNIDYYWDGAGQNIQNTTGSSITVTVPSYNTTYQFDMQSVSSGGTKSAWSSVYSFTTGSAPVVTPGLPTNIVATVTGLAVKITFTKGTNATTTRIDYYWDGVGTGYVDTTGTEFNTTVSAYSTSYSYDMQSIASDGTTKSAWTPEKTFTTGAAPAPTAPTGITSTVNGLDITVNFTKGTNAAKTIIDKYWETGQNNGETTGTSFTFTVPDPNTVYQFDMQSVGADGTTSAWTAVKSFTSGTAPLPGKPSAPYLTGANGGRGDGSLNLAWTAGTNCSTYTLRYKHYDGIYHTITGITGTTYNLTGLQYGVSYHVSVEGVNPTGVSGYSSENTATTAPRIPTITKDSAALTTITIQVGAMTSNYTKITVWKQDPDGVWRGSQDCMANELVSFTGLVTGSSYNFKASSFFDINGVSLESAGYSATLAIACTSRPADWEWSYSINPSGVMYNTVVENGIVYGEVMTYTEWNDFIDTLLDFLAYKGKTPGSYTYVVSKSGCTANIINQAVRLVNQLGFNIPEVSGNVPASVFTSMRDAINSIP